MKHRRLIGEHFKADGTPKTTFSSREAAQQFLLTRHKFDAFRPYQCGFCGQWHLASCK